MNNKMMDNQIIENMQGYILVFDLETTGLPPSRKEPTEMDLDQWPYITQMSAVLYNTYLGNIKAYLNYYVKIPREVKISKEVEAITGISNELCEEKGRPLEEVIHSFYELYARADYIVAHNYKFDSQVFKAEIMRIENPRFITNMFLKKINNNIPISFCTMERYRFVCGIPAVSLKGFRYTKMPKLSEVYNLIFQGYPKKAGDYILHNSMVDTLICLRCLLFLECGQTIREDIFEKIMEICSNPMDKPLYGVMTRHHSVYQII